MELLRHLASNGLKIPTILITAYGDAALLGFDEGDLVASLRKPFAEEVLFSAIDLAISGADSAFTKWRREAREDFDLETDEQLNDEETAETASALMRVPITCQ